MIFFHQNDNYSFEKMEKAKKNHWNNIKEAISKIQWDYSDERKEELKKLKGERKVEKKQTIIINAINEWLKCLSGIFKHDYGLQEIVEADYNKLAEIAELYKKAKEAGEISICSSFGKDFKKEETPEEIFDKIYEFFRKKYGYKFVSELAINVCPYCNRSYINGEKDKSLADFDHFFCKKEYPFLAVSFFNLVPCCPSCNRLKGEKEINVSPHNNDKNLSTDKVIQFSYVWIDINKNASINVNCLNDLMEENIKVFQLEGRYNYHSDLIKEYFYRRECYAKSNIESILKQFSNTSINMTPEEIYYGTFFSEDKYYLRSLSKFTRDIIKQLNEESTDTK